MWQTRRTRDGDQPLIDYVLLAEFDIDTGSTLRHQYPAAIPGYKADWFAEHMLPEGAHNREVDSSYIFLNRTDRHVDEDIWIRPSDKESTPSSPEDKCFLYGLNLVKTKYDSSVRRGAIVKSMCIFSRFHFIEAFKAPLEQALDDFFETRSETVLRDLFEALNAIDISTLPRPDFLECLLMRRGVKYLPVHLSPIVEHTPARWTRSLTARYKDQSFPLTVPCHYTPDEVGEINVSWLVKIFGDSAMRIFHAVMTKQRVLFVGYNHSTRDIARMVLSTVAMVAPPLSGVIRRAFPYANLTDLSFLEVPGYIAGVTNPMFQQHEKWWDLLCVLDLPNSTGTVIGADDEDKQRSGGRSTNAAQSADEFLHVSADQKFLHTVMTGIQSRLGEEWVRQQFLDYTTTIHSHVLDKGLVFQSAKLPDKSRRVIEANMARMALLGSTNEFQQMPTSLWVWANSEAPSTETETNGTLLKAHVSKLKFQSSPESNMAVEIYFDFFAKHLVSEASLQALLVMLPESQGGILPIAAGLCSAHPAVRLYTVQILDRLRQFPSTRPALDSLNSFMRSALDRQMKKWRDGSLVKEAEQARRMKDSQIISTLPNEKAPVAEDDPAKMVENMIETIRHNSVEATQLVESLVSNTLQQLNFLNDEHGATRREEEASTNDIMLHEL